MIDPTSLRIIVLLLPRRVYGYGLLERKWYPLDVARVNGTHPNADWSRQGFDDLELPKGHKTIIKALAKKQMRILDETAHSTYLNIGQIVPNMDVVRGKGVGLAILLHGVLELARPPLRNALLLN